MKDIKFRAWHIKDKVMINFDMQKVIKDQYQQAHLCELIAGTHPDGPLMQFTGLQDKSCVDIYKGDVIQFDNGDSFYIDMESWLECFCTPVGDVKCEDQVRDLYRISKASIIGNIYESPELLEK